MSKKKTNAQIKDCRDKQITAFNAYYNTVMISVGLKHMFEKDAPCTFKVNEPTMHTSDNSVTPDIIFQCDEDKKGIVAEIKSSLPESQKQLLGDSKEQIEKYSRIVKGWKTPTKKVNEHSILLLIDRLDSRRFDTLLTKWITKGKIKTNKKICIAEWQSIQSYKPGTGDVTLVNHRSGSTGCKYFDKKLKDEIVIPTDKFAIEYDERKFVRSSPPDLYIMTQIYQDIFPALAKTQEEFIISIDDITNELEEYYTSWSGLDGEQSQIRKNWVRKAMDSFCNVGIAEKVPEEPNKYKILWGKHFQKNIRNYILDKLCGKERIGIDEKPQKKLTQF